MVPVTTNQKVDDQKEMSIPNIFRAKGRKSNRIPSCHECSMSTPVGFNDWIHENSAPCVGQSKKKSYTKIVGWESYQLLNYIICTATTLLLVPPVLSIFHWIVFFSGKS